MLNDDAKKEVKTPLTKKWETPVLIDIDAGTADIAGGFGGVTDGLVEASSS